MTYFVYHMMVEYYDYVPSSSFYGIYNYRTCMGCIHRSTIYCTVLAEKGRLDVYIIMPACTSPRRS